MGQVSIVCCMCVALDTCACQYVDFTRAQASRTLTVQVCSIHCLSVHQVYQHQPQFQVALVLVASALASVAASNVTRLGRQPPCSWVLHATVL